MLLFPSMPLSRRQFFRRLWSPGDKASPRRLARYEEIKKDVRTYLLPYDFSLTEEQTDLLFAEIQLTLEAAQDDELFSTKIVDRIGKLAETRIQTWRDLVAVWMEIRHYAADHVSAFLSSEANSEAVEQLKQRFGMDDLAELEAELKKRVRNWIAGIEDEKLLQYDVISVKDLVFSEIRSWC
jgi:hypothetical protein